MTNLFRGLLFAFAISTISISAFAQRSNCSVSPEENTITQPDGSKLTLRGLGNEAINYLETVDGFTVLRNKDGFFEYATTDNQGYLVPSGVMASNSSMAKLAFEQHLRYNTTQQQLLVEIHNQLTEKSGSLGKAGPYPFPPKGVRKVPVILVEYPDLRATINKDQFELLFNQINYNGTGSFRDFYLATSHGQLDLTCTVYGWVMADSSYKYYGKTSSPSYGTATRQLLLGALKDANDSFNVDFSQFDNDGDMYVDGVILMHSGIGAEESSAPNSGNHIWSFRSSLSAAQRPTYDGVQVSSYAMFPEKRYNGGAYSMVGIGVMSHEFGHLLDLPDLYSTQYINEGAGNYSLMAGGPWLNSERTPCFNDAWSRIKMGWVSPITITDTALYTLPYSVVDSDMVFKVLTSRSNEYFLLENRQKKGFDSYLPSKGLAIWHINTNLAKLLSEGGGNNVNNDTSQLGVGLLQADGLRHLELNANRGDGTDLFPQTNKNNCTPTTKPSTSLYFKLNGVRQSSNISFTDILQHADSSITFEFGTNTSAAFGANRYSGCGPLNVSFTSNTIQADSFAWKFGNGNTSALANPLQQSFAKTGIYQVQLNTFLKGQPMDSSVQTIKVLETPEISYGYVRDTGYYVQFTNTSAYNKLNAWRFTSVDTMIDNYEANPLIQVKGPVKMLVRYTATSNDGCVKVKQDSIQIFALGLTNNVANSIQLGAYPNPFANYFTVNFKLTQSGLTTLELYNILGAKVLQQQLGKLGNGEHKINVDAAELSNGTYLLKLTTPEGNAWIKLVK